MNCALMPLVMGSIVSLFPTVGVSSPTLILKCVCVIFQVRKEEADEKERRPTDSQAHGRNEILYGDH